MTPCARPGCGVALTAVQVARGQRFHSRPCHGLARRQPVAGRVVPTHCRVCSTPLTWAQARRGEHCSLRCVMRTRHGTAAPTRTHCANCDQPLTRRQRWRRRDYCSRACAKAAEWRRRPDIKARAVANAHATLRRAFIRRLRAFLQACPTQTAAGARGFRNGWGAARRRARAAGHPQPRHTQDRSHRARIATIAAAAPSKAEAYRRCYTEAYARAWVKYAGRRPAAA